MQEASKRLKEFLSKPVYSRVDLYDIIYRVYPTYSINSCNWVIGTLLADGLLQPLGNGLFSLPKRVFNPSLDKSSYKVLKSLLEAFPLTEFAAIETTVLDELIGEEASEKALILNVSKRDLFPCYLKIRELTKREVMLNPSSRELDYYLKPGSIILKPLFSKSPVRDDGIYTAEKLIVDLWADKTIGALYGGLDSTEICHRILNENNVNITTVINYARRRGIMEAIMPVIENGVQKEVWARYRRKDK